MTTTSFPYDSHTHFLMVHKPNDTLNTKYVVNTSHAQSLNCVSEMTDLGCSTS